MDCHESPKTEAPLYHEDSDMFYLSLVYSWEDLGKQYFKSCNNQFPNTLIVATAKLCHTTDCIWNIDRNPKAMFNLHKFINQKYKNTALIFVSA